LLHRRPGKKRKKPLSDRPYQEVKNRDYYQRNNTDPFFLFHVLFHEQVNGPEKNQLEKKNQRKCFTKKRGTTKKNHDDVSNYSTL